MTIQQFRTPAKYFLLLLVTSCLLPSAGCTRYPADFPKTYPCKVTVTKGGQPLEAATVILVSQSIPPNILCSGVTNSEGVADITSTYASFVRKGAPLAEYQVSIQKEVEVPHTKTKEERVKLSPREHGAYSKERMARAAAMPRIVPKTISEPGVSPITWKVEKAGNQLTVEVDDYSDK